MQLYKITSTGPRPLLNGQCDPPTKSFAHPWPRPLNNYHVVQLRQTIFSVISQGKDDGVAWVLARRFQSKQ